MTDLQMTMAVVFAVMAVVAVALVAWGASGFFDKAANAKASDHEGPDGLDAVAEMQRKNLAAKQDHNSKQQ